MMIMMVTAVMNNKVAIFSDIHLGVHQNSSFWIEVSLDWVDWFKQDIQSKGITDVIFCGDFFHYRDEVSLISLDAGNKILDKLKGFNVYMITGNHDCYYKETSEVNSLSIFKGRDNITVYDSVHTKLVGDKKLTFCPWGTKISDIANSDILFGHFELQNFKMNAFKVCDNGDSPEELTKKAPLVFSGHFHLRDEKKFDTSTIVYVGNPFEMDFGDAYQRKGYYTLDIQQGSYEFIENANTPKHVKVYLSKLIKLKDVDTNFKSFIPNNLIKLVIDKNISSEHLDALIAKMSTYKPNDLHVDYDVNYNKIKLSDDTAVDLSGVDIIKAIEDFVAMLDINNKKEVVDYTIGLYNKSKL